MKLLALTEKPRSSKPSVLRRLFADGRVPEKLASALVKFQSQLRADVCNQFKSQFDISLRTNQASAIAMPLAENIDVLDLMTS